MAVKSNGIVQRATSRFFPKKGEKKDDESSSQVESKADEISSQVESKPDEDTGGDVYEKDSGDLGMKIEFGGKNPVFEEGDWKHLDTQEYPNTEYITKTFVSIPFEDDVIEKIFAKRIIQRLSKKEARLALQDWFRVLEPLGSIKLVTVDINKAMGKYLQTFEEKYLDFIYGDQTDRAEFYLSGYSSDILKKIMTDVGFINVRESTPSVDYFDPQIEFVLEADKPKDK